MPRIEEPPEPWRSFFAEVDSRLREDVHLHCCGGFVVIQLYGVARTTSDVDFLAVVPNVRSELTQIAAKVPPCTANIRSAWMPSQSRRHQRTTKNGWCRCFPAHGVTFA